MAKTVSAAEVQTHLLDLLDEQTEFVITKDGEPVARVVPIAELKSADDQTIKTDIGAVTGDETALVIGTSVRRHMTLEELRSSIHIVGDIMEPVDEWDVER